MTRTQRENQRALELIQDLCAKKCGLEYFQLSDRVGLLNGKTFNISIIVIYISKS